MSFESYYNSYIDSMATAMNNMFMPTSYIPYGECGDSFMPPIFGNFGNFNIKMPAFDSSSLNFNMSLPAFDSSNLGFNIQLPAFNFQLPPLPSFSGMFGSGESGSSGPVDLNCTAAELKKTWHKKNRSLSDEFYNKVVEVAKKVKCSANDLMAMMYSESGLKTTTVNRSSGATGLIQFMPDTAREIGTTTTALKRMSAVEQLTYVEKYILMNKRNAGYSENQVLDTGTLYAINFLPAYAKREVLSTQNDKYYSANKGLDVNKDGKITKTELANRLKGYYA